MRNGILRVLVVVVALHSAVIGVLLIIDGRWLFSQFGWIPDCDGFFFHQVGVFHIVLAVIYLTEFLRYRRVTTILIAKSVAFGFLLLEFALVSHEVSVLLAGVGDGCLGAAVSMCYSRSHR